MRLGKVNKQETCMMTYSVEAGRRDRYLAVDVGKTDLRKKGI